MGNIAVINVPERKKEIQSYIPLPKQRLFHNSDADLRLFQGGFGAGKSLTGCEEALDLSLAYPKNFGVIIRKTYRELVDTTQKTMFEIAPSDLYVYRARDEMMTFTNGSVIIFRSLDKAFEKFKSMNLGWAYVDEASEIEDEDIPLMLMSRLRLTTVPWRGMFFTSNPPTIEHWIHEWFINKALRKPDRYFMVQATTYENPHLPKYYVEMLEEEYGSAWTRRFLLGEFGFLSKGTPVWTHFNHKLHVVEGLAWEPDRPVIRSWDFGFNHPCVTYHQIGPNRSWHILREKMGTRTLLHKFADEVVLESNERFPGATWIDVGDPAGDQKSDKNPQTSIEILRARGINVRTRRMSKKKSIEDIDQWLEKVRKDREGNIAPAVKIDAHKCPITIEAFEGGYAWPKSRDGRISREEPLEDGYYEHPADSIRYAFNHMFLGGGIGATIQEIVTPRWRF